MKNQAETNLEIINGEPMMGSRKIAVATGKNHDHVKRDILAMLEQLKIHHPDQDDDDSKGFIISRKHYQGRDVIDEIWLNETLSMTLVTGYDATRRLALVEQWQDMKAELSQPRLTAPAPQDINMNNDILSLARVVAEATASATMKAVIDIVGIPKHQSLPAVQPAPVIAAPAQSTFDLQVSHLETDSNQSEYVLVADLAWTCGFSDAACRRLVTFAKLPTRLTKGESGHLLVNRESFMAAAQTLLNESTPPTGKLKRWRHPEFGGFTLRLASEKHTGEDE
ncbi:Rha family transcriptional regulator [Rahnella sp. ChDrAdgB13]|uniref:Rha family transcriptional regulator n=1 Tax=Rahnella sp. ChDrAdgB13 TaxID=1850581 RepID=UPI001FCB59F3|nr:Rha family transcriptional regulator [Rahnella sp. ChDrAdgB13]